MRDVYQQGRRETGENGQQKRQGSEQNRVAVKHILDATSSHARMGTCSGDFVMWGIYPKSRKIFSGVPRVLVFRLLPAAYQQLIKEFSQQPRNRNLPLP
jgi:hypothetical protein